MILSIKNIHKSYGNLNVLQDFSLELDKSRIHCFFGPSGCGKTTLMHVMAGILKPDSGEIIIPKDIRFSYIFQEERLLPWMTVEENVALVLQDLKDQGSIERQVKASLSLVELNDFAKYFPSELSGGMRQRVSIARAFAYEGEVLAMDEPFKGLHLKLKQNLMDAIYKYWTLHKPYTYFITHDIDDALYIADDIYIFDGPPMRLVEKINIQIPHELRKDHPELLMDYKIKLSNQTTSLTQPSN
ncbi:ABC transporter ATP-binding protein [Petrocella atlantisensis]|uniref:ABC transporter ATP-binding protein n=1 Tax=Petrocella atlantisensis TaxID=2173034 RepID=A0A3P7P4G6_9FIRM|nr:ABC transporter ATP-binding protein [Petrocella atlantisensis]MCF8020139.1 ABC transporter ATP-binding protein [Vallitaleaceae bacterium]VDN48450.1 ABC transporter ATP-binding protein [Petrocella atlantisensis]